MRLAIVGGGITGLAAAHRAMERAAEVALYEASSRWGGIVRSERHEGYLLEAGPDSFLTDPDWAKSLVERVGLGDCLIGVRPEFRQSYVVRQGRLVPTPPGFQLLAPSRLGPMWRSPLLSLGGKVRVSLEPFVPRRGGGQDESLGSFVRRRLGREVLERIAQPMVGGIYGADPDDLSLRSTFPRFLELEERLGSVVRGLGATSREVASGPRYGLFAALRDGSESWTEALVAKLPLASRTLETRVEAIAPQAGGWILRTSQGEVGVDRLLLAIRAPEAARLVRDLDPELGRLLESISFGSGAAVSLAYPESAIAHPLDGSGFVVPALEGLSILGCTFVHRKFPGRAPAGHALLRAFHGDAAAERSDQELVGETRLELDRLLGISASPHFARVTRHPRSMPRYRVGHLDLVRSIEARVASLPGLALAGASYHGVGLPHCVKSGEDAVERLLRES